MITITSKFLLLFQSLTGCRFAREESMEKTGTMKNWAQKGAERRYHGSVGGRKQPNTMYLCFEGMAFVKTNVLERGTTS
jgi:hypothetical protein